jgi:hypothetical protein
MLIVHHTLTVGIKHKVHRLLPQAHEQAKEQQHWAETHEQGEEERTAALPQAPLSDTTGPPFAAGDTQGVTAAVLFVATGT